MIVIVDYGMGNVSSIANMLKRIGASTSLTADPTVISRAEKLILPGVGAFDSGMANLQRRGLLDVLYQKVVVERTPILGICLGMQLFSRCSEEGRLPGLGWIDAETVRIRPPVSSGLKVPHMGWNFTSMKHEDSILSGFTRDSSKFYFVHSYHVVCRDIGNVVASVSYGQEIAAIIRLNNIIGTQFHPEKSHKYGMLLLRNFVA